MAASGSWRGFAAGGGAGGGGGGGGPGARRPGGPPGGGASFGRFSAPRPGAPGLGPGGWGRKAPGRRGEAQAARAGWFGGAVNGGFAAQGAGAAPYGPVKWLWNLGKVPPPRQGQKRVVILMSDTGGGHRASAQALQATFEELYGAEFEVTIVDLWSNNSPWPVNQMPKGYSTMVKYPWMWRASFRFLWPSWVHEPTFFMYHKLLGRLMAQALLDLQPDLVVSVHPLMQHIPLKVMRNLQRSGKMKKVPFATVVTDFTTCHSTWFHRKVDRCYVATEEAKELALTRGLKESQLVVYGLPIRPVFSQTYSKAKLRSKLKMDPAKPAVLVCSGGEGMGPVEETIQSIGRELGGKVQVVVICGRNKRLAERLAAAQFPMKLIVNGFVRNMHEWMYACDSIVTKAGPGTIAESLICGLPLVLNAFVPCQEEGNIPYVVNNRVGDFTKDPAEVGRILSRWLDDKKAFSEMAKRAKALGAPKATFNIVKDLAQLCIEAYKPARKSRRALATLY